MKKFKLNKKTIICLVLVVLTFSNSYLLAKYASSVRGQGSKSVAKWKVNCVSNDSNTLNLVSGNHTESYNLDVTSTSEVSANYSVILSNIPSELEVMIDNSNEYITPDINNTIIFDNVGSFTANDVNNTYTHTITFNAPLDSNIPSTNSINIDVVFDQID